MPMFGRGIDLLGCHVAEIAEAAHRKILCREAAGTAHVRNACIRYQSSEMPDMNRGPSTSGSRWPRDPKHEEGDT